MLTLIFTEKKIINLYKCWRFHNRLPLAGLQRCPCPFQQQWADWPVGVPCVLSVPLSRQQRWGCRLPGNGEEAGLATSPVKLNHTTCEPPVRDSLCLTVWCKPVTKRNSKRKSMNTLTMLIRTRSATFCGVRRGMMSSAVMSTAVCRCLRVAGAFTLERSTKGVMPASSSSNSI